MKTAVLSLIIAMLVAILSVFQFERYQNFTVDTEQSIAELNEKIDNRVATLNQKITMLEDTLSQNNPMAGNLATSGGGAPAGMPVPGGMSASAGRMGTAGMSGNMPGQAMQDFYPEGAKEDWSINTAYHLSRLAAAQLQMANDVPNALSLLQEASQALQSVPNEKAEALRDELNKQITKLKGVKMPEATEIWETLGNMIEQIHTLPLRGDRNIHPKNARADVNATVNAKTSKNANARDFKDVKDVRGNKSSNKVSKNKKAKDTEDDEQNTAENALKNDSENVVENPSEEESKKGWRNALKNTWSDLKNLVKIQRHTKPIEPLLPTAEQRLAYENLTLLLEQARWATLNKNQIIYQEALQQAKHLVATHFATEDANVDAFGEHLDELSKINLKPELPDLKPLLNLFAKKIDQQNVNIPSANKQNANQQNTNKQSSNQQNENKKNSNQETVNKQSENRQNANTNNSEIKQGEK